ncbi:MAG TPA: hypothetical protein HA349_05570 [Methanotrichaceae archaeon]|nr:hypothetical protein [Methanotrichaceae archaeon]
MSDYLSRLAARNLNLVEVVQPRLWSLFEPPSSDGGPVFEQHFDSGEQDEVFVSNKTEPYAHKSMLPSSSLLADSSAESALSEEVRTETVGEFRRKVADPQTPILSQPQPDLDEAKSQPIPEVTEDIPVETSSEIASPDRKQSIYSVAAMKTEKAGTIRRNAVDTQPIISEKILSQLLLDPNKTETIPVMPGGETHRTDSQSSSEKVLKQKPPDQRQPGSPATTVRTDTIGTVRRKAFDPQPLTTETILNQPLPDPDEAKRHPGSEKKETIPVTSRSEMHRTESQSLSRKISEQMPPDQRQPGSTAAMVRAEAVEKVRRKAFDPQPLTSEPILNQPQPDPDKAKRHPDSEEKETIPVTSRSEIHRTESQSSSRKVLKQTPPDQRKPGSSAATVRTETIGTVRRKAVDAPSPSSETILSQPRPDLDEAKRHPGSEKKETIPVTSSSEMHRTESQSLSWNISEQTPLDQRKPRSTAAMVRAETVEKVRRKAVDAPSTSSEPILSQPLTDPEKTQRQPSPENVKNLAVTASSKTQNVVPQSVVKADLVKTSHPATSQTLAEDHPFYRQIQSGPERRTSRKVEGDDEKITVSSRGQTEKGLLPARSSRAAVIAKPEASRFMEPPKQTTPQPMETNPTIRVNIGRVEVRATTPPAPTSPPPPQSASPAAQKLSLDDYLKLRNGGRL